jgi:hypothetical protein
MGSKLHKLLKGPAVDSYTIDHIKHVLNTEAVRRLLVSYFMSKGFQESFDRQLYPAIVQDLPLALPILSNKLEIVPHAKEIDTAMGRGVLGWNLFCLGNQRMYLGETYHNSLQDLARQIRTGMVAISENGVARHQTTPRRIITFITRVLGDHEAGYVDLTSPRQQQQRPGDSLSSRMMMGMPQQFNTRGLQ